MITRLRRLRPSPAMVVACLALLVALAGTSVAAVQVVIPTEQRRCARSSSPIRSTRPRSRTSRCSRPTSRRARSRPARAASAARPVPAVQPVPPARPAPPARRRRCARVRRRGADGRPARARPRRSSTSFTATRRGDAERDRPDQRDGQAARLLQRRVRVLRRQPQAHAACVRITVDDNEIAPAPDNDSSFDNNVTSTQRTANTQAQHGIVRISPTLSRGRAHGQGRDRHDLGVDDVQPTTTGRWPSSASASPNSISRF